MKLLFCRKCGQIVQLTAANFRSCRCGNVTGKYKTDQNSIEIDIKNRLEARIIGINNAFLFRDEPPSWDSPIYEDTLFREQKSHIVAIRPLTAEKSAINQAKRCPVDETHLIEERSIHPLKENKRYFFCQKCAEFYTIQRVREAEAKRKIAKE